MLLYSARRYCYFPMPWLITVSLSVLPDYVAGGWTLYFIKKLHFVFLCKYCELCLALVTVVYDFTSTTIYYLWDHIFLSSNPGTREKSFSTETCRAITDIKINVP